MEASGQGSTSGALQPGTVLGRYRVVRLLGEGGMGAVYEAVHQDLQKRVALKTLHPNLAGKPGIMSRFLREGVAASRIRHANAVDVTDVASQDGIAYMVMEFLDGETLASLIAREGALPPERIGEIMLPVMAAVNAAHREGIVHRDLKPENIMLHRTRDGDLVPKVLDFGISKLGSPGEGQGQALTGTGAMLGTPNYMSPEQVRSTKHVDARSDQYSLGVILYECVTGKRAFEGETLFVIFNAIVTANFPPPSRLRPDLPPAFEAMVLRAMSTAPDQRFESVGELARELSAIAGAARPSWVHGSAGATGPQPVMPAAGRPDTLASAAREIHGTLAPAGSPHRARLKWLVAGGVGLAMLAGGLLVASGAFTQSPVSPATQVAPAPPPAVPIRPAAIPTPAALPVVSVAPPVRPVASPLPPPTVQAPQLTPVAAVQRAPDAGAAARPGTPAAGTPRPTRYVRPQGPAMFPGAVPMPVAPQPPANVFVPAE